MKTVIEMAREAGFVVCRNESMLREMLEVFANLVRKDYSFTHAQMWLKRFDDAVKAEREACATECERMMMYPNAKQEAAAHDNVWAAAKAIRARGNT